jgi:hypothetical protein
MVSSTKMKNKYWNYQAIIPRSLGMRGMGIELAQLN